MFSFGETGTVETGSAASAAVSAGSLPMGEARRAEKSTSSGLLKLRRAGAVDGGSGVAGLQP